MPKPSFSSVDSANRAYFTKQDTCSLPDLIEIQKDSYNEFIKNGLQELFAEISPITDFTEKKLELRFIDYKIDEPQYDEATASYKNITFEAAIRVQVELVNKISGEVKEQDVYLGNIPVMTERGTFIVNGVERVVVNQINRAPGIYFLKNQEDDGYTAKIIPNRGAWIELKTNKKGVISVKIDKKRKMPATALLRAFGYGTNDEILDLFKDIRKDIDPEKDLLMLTLDKDTANTEEEGLAAFYKRMRPGDLATTSNTKQLLESIFFDFRRYDMGKVGRYKVNQKFGVDKKNTRENRIFDVQDLVFTMKELQRLTNGESKPDDIDNLSNRRIRSVGELVQNKF